MTFLPSIAFSSHLPQKQHAAQFLQAANTVHHPCTVSIEYYKEIFHAPVLSPLNEEGQYPYHILNTYIYNIAESQSDDIRLLAIYSFKL